MSAAVAPVVGLRARVITARAASSRGATVRASPRSSASAVSTPSSRVATRVRAPLAAGPPRPAARGALARASALSPLDAALPDLASSPALVAEVADGLEGGIQAIYLGALLSILGFAGFIVVRQVFIRRELDASAKAMGERIRSGDATAEEYFEMGSIMLRKKVYTQAVRNLKLAAERWEGDKEDLAQIHNALGFGYLSTEKFEESVAEFKTAVELQPGYVTAWNNLGDALERMNDRKGAMAAYEESLVLSPGNQVAENRLAEIKRRLSRLNQL
jgi:tetratricopeptide (TPR) repeat protein